MHHLLHSTSAKRDFVCATCELMKHQCSVLPSRVEKHVRFSFSLSYSDVWGPTRIRRMLGHRYSVTPYDLGVSNALSFKAILHSLYFIFGY